MGTVPIAENLRIACQDGTLIKVEALTTTSDLMMGADGSVGVYGDVDGVEAFSFQVSLTKFTDLWMARLCDALAADAGFRARLATVDDGDDLVIPAVPARNGDLLAALVSKGKAAKFKDFAGLRSGRDRFSAMRLPELESEAGTRAIEEMNKRTGHLAEEDRATERAKILRWFLRGLPMAMAVRKVDVDREVSANVAGRGR